jgi:hypothetical protein
MTIFSAYSIADCDDIRGETIQEHIVSLDTVIFNSPDYSALTMAEYIWQGGDGLYLCFKLLNCDVN